jgi:hypothetical protein
MGALAQANSESRERLEVLIVIAGNETLDLIDMVLEWVKRSVYTASLSFYICVIITGN